MELCLRATTEQGLTDDELRAELVALLERHTAKKVLLLPPDYTRYYSKAGFLTQVCYSYYTAYGAEVDLLPTLGTHRPMTRAEAADMFGEIPFERVLEHRWRTDVVNIGEVPGEEIARYSDGLWTTPIPIEVNRIVMDESYDLILSLGQVVPHEVIGMSNHAKNIFVGAGGAGIIHSTHLLGALYGMERVMGRDNSPVRKVMDYALAHFLGERPVLFLLTVTTAPEGETRTHGLFGGRERDALEAAIELSQQQNITFLPHGIAKCVVYLDPKEYHSTWLGNKAIYRTRMAIADGGELIILAPGVDTFGEDRQVDALIRKYGYCGRERAIALLNRADCADLRENASAAAHLIHGSSDGRFTVSYAVRDSLREAVSQVGYASLDLEVTMRRYDPAALKSGYNTLPDGEEIYYIPNPGLGLWIDGERFARESGQQ